MYHYGIEMKTIKRYTGVGIVLIVPLWNWNLTLQVSLLTIRCFNCTILELKFDLGLMPLSEQVLIVLSWNWNKEFKDIVTHYADVLIVSSWNWNIGVSQLANALNVVLIVLSWNLNIKGRSLKIIKLCNVLIVLSWNWNSK